MNYEIAAGRIQTFSLETHLVDHCNLRCEGCCQLSPFMPSAFADPEQLERALRRAAQVLRPAVFKLTGGEPLLHPEVGRCLGIVRRSGIAPVVQITTNGFRLADAPDEVYQQVDRIKLSAYVSAPLPADALSTLRRRCAEHGVALETRVYAEFQDLDREAPASPQETREAFASCWMRVRCHLIHRGRFYTCSRPQKVDARLRQRGLREDLALVDGVDLQSTHLLQAILAELQREEPLATCTHCRGATGEWRPHRQLSSAELQLPPRT